MRIKTINPRQTKSEVDEGLFILHDPDEELSLRNTIGNVQEFRHNIPDKWFWNSPNLLMN